MAGVGGALSHSRFGAGDHPAPACQGSPRAASPSSHTHTHTPRAGDTPRPSSEGVRRQNNVLIVPAPQPPLPRAAAASAAPVPRPGTTPAFSPRTAPACPCAWGGRGRHSSNEQGVLPGWGGTPTPLPAPREPPQPVQSEGSRTAAGPHGSGRPLEPPPCSGRGSRGGGQPRGGAEGGVTSGGSQSLCRRSCPPGQSPR